MKVRVIALVGRMSSPTTPASVLTQNPPTGLPPATSTLELPLPRALQNLARDEPLREVLSFSALFGIAPEDLGGPESSDSRADPGSGEASIGFVSPPLGVDRLFLEALPCSGEGARGRFKVLATPGQPLEAPLHGLGALDLPVYSEVIELTGPVNELFRELGDGG